MVLGKEGNTVQKRTDFRGMYLFTIPGPSKPKKTCIYIHDYNQTSCFLAMLARRMGTTARVQHWYLSDEVEVVGLQRALDASEGGTREKERGD